MHKLALAVVQYQKDIRASSHESQLYVAYQSLVTSTIAVLQEGSEI